MANKIQLRRGTKTQLQLLGNLAAGEPGFTTDTNELFIGTPTGNLKVAMSGEQYIFGYEYLTYYHELIRSKQPVKMIFSGDSTVEGVGVTDPNFLIHNIAKDIAVKRGVKRVTSINTGHSNMRTPQWQSTYLAQDIAESPNLYVLRWGLNDGAHTPIPARTSVFENALRGGLATLRSSKNANQMSVVLMMPNSTNDPANGRDALWFETIYRIIKRAARDYQCCFVDTYHWMEDSTNVIWEDDAAGVHIHPLNIGNAMLASLLEDVLVPASLRDFGVTNPLSTDKTRSVTDKPSTYPIGVSIYRTDASFPYNGQVVTHYGVDGVLIQINSGLMMQSTESIAFRRGLAVDGTSFGGIGNDAWAPWVVLRNSEPYQNLTLINSWVNEGGTGSNAQFMLDGSGNTHIKGRIKSGTITLGTVIATLPTGYRPLQETDYVVNCNSTFGVVRVKPNGDIIAIVIPSNVYIDFGRIIFKAEQ